MPPPPAATRATRPFNPKSIASTFLAAKILQRHETPVEQPCGVVVEDDGRASLLRKDSQQLLGLVGDAARAGQTPYDASLVVRNCQLVERADPAAEYQYNVARSDEHDVTPFQTEAREDENVRAGDRQTVAPCVLAFI